MKVERRKSKNRISVLKMDVGTVFLDDDGDAMMVIKMTGDGSNCVCLESGVLYRFEGEYEPVPGARVVFDD